MRRAVRGGGRDSESPADPALYHHRQAAWGLFAKGRILGLQFDALFTDGLYSRIGKPAIDAADKIRAALERAGYEQHFRSPTNQIFVVLEKGEFRRLSEKIEFSFWEKKDDTHTVIRIATSWATTREETDSLVAVLSSRQA